MTMIIDVTASLSKSRNFLKCCQTLLISLIALLFLCNLQVDRIRSAFIYGNNNNVKITTHGIELTQAINLQRQEYLQKQCELLGYNNQTLDDLTDVQMEHMIIDRKHKFMYCYVPKVACTNWKRMLMILTGRWTNGTDPLQIPDYLPHSAGMFQKFTTLTPKERSKVMSEYTRLMLVRNPFERLLSAYRNKLEEKTTSARRFQSLIGSHIIKAMRANPSNQSLEYANDITFGELAQYLLTPQVSVTNHTYNEHWEPMSKLCNPCVMKYNVIGKYETLLDDSALALYLTGEKNLTFPSENNSSNTRSHLRTYFDPLPIGAIRRLYEIYMDDFRLFDYGLDDVLGFEFQSTS